MNSSKDRVQCWSACRIRDCDWHLLQLYDFAAGLGASTLHSPYSRYTVDLNRAPDNTNLYPGKDSTEVCPSSTFSLDPIYKRGCEPSSTEIQQRVDQYWNPYHEALQIELERLKKLFGVAVLFEAHSICSRVPRLFEGRLPDLNIGTNDGKSCSADLETVILSSLHKQNTHSVVLNQRFKGGYITRTYGSPRAGCHAVQLELSQQTYMEESYPFTYIEERAATVKPVLEGLIQATLNWALSQ
ncbi:MAG: N-formylglutamate deformylase [Pseudomonadota bacterium]